MMVDTMDMSAPVTRGELREELDRAFEQRLAPLVTKEHLEERLKTMASKEDLDTWGGALLEEIKKRIREELRSGMNEMKSELKSDLNVEFTKSIKSMEETFRKQVSTFDDKYMDLPKRVTRLEGAVFPDNQQDNKPATRSDDKPGAKAESKKARQVTHSSKPARSPKRR